MAEESLQREVLAWLQAVMRGESDSGEAIRCSQRLKAAELLARHFGLLNPGPGGPPDPRVADELAEALERLKEANEPRTA
ncbi:MAG: hypothetical protein IKP40_11670 [Clostridia bacterium]|nr:hypothetical protein [Clostridia bacterium]